MYLCTYIYSYSSITPLSSHTHILQSQIIGGYMDTYIYDDKDMKHRYNRNGWGYILLDALTISDVLKQQRILNHIDYKYSIYGHEQSGPLTLKLNIETKNANVS